MDIIIQVLSPISIFIIGFIIASLIIAYYKKYMLTFAIILINFIVFVLSLFFSDVISELAFKPIYLTLEQIPQIYTLFTSMFLHSTRDFAHILFNMFMFILIAPSFEEKIGAKKFIAIFIITGICAALFHALVAPIITGATNPYIGLIGASGAISGILGAYAAAYPKDKVFFPVFFIIRMPVLVAGLIFLTIQTFFIFTGGDPRTAYLAHVGGFIAGIIIATVLIRSKGPGLYEKVPLEKRVYDSYAQPRKRKIDYSNLKKLATTPKLKEMLKKIENENVPQVQDIWLEHFFEKTHCPKCKSSLKHFNGKIWCEKCGFKTKY
jgi:membrane associated rhomboid family serine protease